MANLNTSDDIHYAKLLLQRMNDILKPTINFAQNYQSKVSSKAAEQYKKDYERIANFKFEALQNSQNILSYGADQIFTKVVEISHTKSTLRKYARSIRFAHFETLKREIVELSNIVQSQDANRLNEYVNFQRNHDRINIICDLAKAMPSSYLACWLSSRVDKKVGDLESKKRAADEDIDDDEIYNEAEYFVARQSSKRPNSKKYSIKYLPADWLEQLALKLPLKNQFAIPALVMLATGARPAELEKEVKLEIIDNKLRVIIQGAKVTHHAGQDEKQYILPDNNISALLIKYVETHGGSTIIKVNRGNSVSKFISRTAKQIWSKKKKSISAYSIRHQIAEFCKEITYRALKNDNTYPSKVLGHRVNKTISFYVLRRGANSKSRPIQNLSNENLLKIAPLDIKVTHPVKLKNKAYRGVTLKSSGPKT